MTYSVSGALYSCDNMAGEDRQSDMVSYLDFIPPVVDNPRDAVAMATDLYAPQLAEEERDVTSVEMSERHGGCP